MKMVKLSRDTTRLLNKPVERAAGVPICQRFLPCCQSWIFAPPLTLVVGHEHDLRSYIYDQADSPFGPPGGLFDPRYGGSRESAPSVGEEFQLLVPKGCASMRWW
jgi:hypothetical protein